MLIESIARRYAKALFDAATGEKSIDTVWHELSGFVETLAKENRLKDLWFAPRLPEAEKKEIIRRFFPELSKLIFNFLSLLVDKRREKIIDVCAVEYEKLMREFYNQVFVEVKTAVPMSEAVEEELRRRLADTLGKRIELMISHEPSLLGGMVLKIGDSVVDGSIRTKLEAIHEDLLNAPLPA